MTRPVKRLLLASLCVAGLSGPAGAIGLVESYHLAQENDPTLAASWYSLAAALEKRPQARANLLPSVGANGSYGQADNKVRFGRANVSDRNIENYGWNLQLVQPLFHLQDWATYDQAGELIAQAQAEFNVAQQELILKLSQAYLDLLLAQESIAVANAEEAAARRQIDQSERSFKVGIVPVTDVYEAKTRMSLAQAQTLAAISERETKQAELEKLTGPIPDAVLPLKADWPLPRPQPADAQSWIDNAAVNHPIVQARRAAVRVAEKEISRQRAAHLPTLNVTASYGNAFDSGNATLVSDTDTRNESAQIGLQVSVPIFSGGAIVSRVTEATANLERVRSELEATRREVATMARQAYAGVVNGISQTAALRSAVDFGQLSVEANTAGYRVGTRISLDVLTASQQYHMALRDHAEARFETLMQGLRLKAAVGALQESDLMSIDGHLEHAAVNSEFNVGVTQNIASPATYAIGVIGAKSTFRPSLKVSSFVSVDRN